MVYVSGLYIKQKYGSIGLPHRLVYLGLIESRNIASRDSYTDGFIWV